MVAISFDDVREYDDEQFRTVPVYQSERVKVVLGYVAPGQFIPVHAPDSDVVIDVRAGTGVVRDGEVDRQVTAGDVLVVAAGVDRGIRADDDSHLDAVLVTTPPPTDAEHEPVREGLRRGEFDGSVGDD